MTCRYNLLNKDTVVAAENPFDYQWTLWPPVPDLPIKAELLNVKVGPTVAFHKLLKFYNEVQRMQVQILDSKDREFTKSLLSLQPITCFLERCPQPDTGNLCPLLRGASCPAVTAFEWILVHPAKVSSSPQQKDRDNVLRFHRAECIPFKELSLILRLHPSQFLC